LRVLVTGGAGFIGSHLIDRLVARGDEVLCLDAFIASSSSIYGNPDTSGPLVEDASYLPISPYAATKRAGELWCHTFHHLHGLPVTCLRFFTVYGPRQRPDMAIHKFVRMMDAGEAIPRFGDGTSRRDYTYVADIIQGVEAALDRVLDFEIINLGESRTISLNELIGTIERVTGLAAVIDEKPWQPGDVVETYADISKARKQLGYAPKFPLEKGCCGWRRWW